MNRRSIMTGSAALALPVLLRAGPVEAQAVPADPGPASRAFRVGSRELIIVTDGVAPRTATTPGVAANASPEQATAALRAAGFPGPEFLQPFNPLILRTPAGLVLFDVGTGGLTGPRTGQLLANMQAAGLDPARVLAVALTHLHPDHFGGLVDANGAANFPNARVLVGQQELAFWTEAGEEGRMREQLRGVVPNARRRLAPYQGRIETFSPGAEVLPGVTAVDSPGHTPGHAAFLIADGGQQAMVTGDALHMPAFYFANPDWYTGFDTDPATAVATRRRLLDRLATDRVSVAIYHAAMPGFGTVERAGDGYRLIPAG